MNLSKAQLYRMGEPLGDGVTRIEPGRRLICGGGGSSKSSATTTTTNIDKRQVIEGGIGISTDGSTVNVQALDGEIVKKALDTVTAADAAAGQSFDRLLGLADKLFSGAGAVVEKTQDTALAQIDAINAARADAAGTIDQKTLIVLAVAGAAAWVAARGK